MASCEILSTYIKKLSHPLKEIRERSLQLLVAKLRLGWELDDELAGTRELLESLLAWFHVQKPSLQREALDLLLSTIKTKAGTYIAKEFGISKILSSLNAVKNKIEEEAQEAYDDVLETLLFLNTVESEDNVSVPRLTLPSLTSSDSERGSSNGYYNLGPNFQSSKETSVSNEEVHVYRCNVTKAEDGIIVLLFPWVELCSSDSKTMLLVEDALKLLKSTRRCCRFIRDVFLRDFPPEIFLNRPAIIQNLLIILDGGSNGHPGEALHVLLCITRALILQLLQLSSLDLIHEANKILDDYKELDDGINLELEQIGSGGLMNGSHHDDGLAALRQLPAPIYALDTLHAVLSIMARSVVLVDPVNKSEVLDLKELNICTCLVQSLIQLLLDCVSDIFWSVDHNSKIHRDIAHKSCMVMRLMGDLLTKYRKSFTVDLDRVHHRVVWLRLVSYAERLLHWARDSALPPSTLVAAIQIAQLDPALELVNFDLSKRIATVLKSARISVDQEYKSKYRELMKLYASMNEAVQFIKNKNSCRSSKNVLKCIKNSLPALEIHLNETYLKDVVEILLHKIKDFDLNDDDWSVARSIALNLMSHRLEWVRTNLYKMLADMVKSVLMSDENNQTDNEKCLALLCDVGMLTEICCHGLTSKLKEVEESASEIMLYLLRGRLILSESCWWRLLASLLPILPLLHVYAAHDTQLGKAICKSLELDIAECMGVPVVEVVSGLVRLLFVRCPSVQLDAAHSLCLILDDEKYLPPKELLRADVLMNALGRINPQGFNVDFSASPPKIPQTTGLTQILDVLKQDIVLDENGSDFVARSTVQPILEPSLRRSTLQQLSVLLQQQESHDTFLQCDGLRLIVSILRMSLTVDDYLAFPECAISCVSVLNSICFVSRHSLAKIPDLFSLLLRVILVFPANDSAVLMSAQIVALVAWSGFVLQELDSSRQQVPALPSSVTERISLPFNVNSYWSSSPNAEHSSVEWLLADEAWRAAIRVRWWCAWEGVTRAVRGATASASHAALPSLCPTPSDRALLQTACPLVSCTKALMALENATSHRQVNEALHTLESYVHLLPSCSVSSSEFSALPWHHMRRFLCAPPASPRDTALLITLLQFILAYMDNVPKAGTATSWIKSYFIGNDATIISLLSREQLYLQQTPQENIEVTQLHIHIVKVLLRCVILLEYDDDYDFKKMESLLKILLACLERVDLKNFHVLGYLNELMRCIRYALNSRYCKLSEEVVVNCLKVMTRTLIGCASGGGRKGQACRLDALLSLLALLRQIKEEALPVQRWSEAWNSDVVHAVAACSGGERQVLRAAALYVMAALANYAQLLPQLLQAIPNESLSQFAAGIFSQSREANVVRTAAADLLATITVRTSPQSDVLECDVLEQLKENNFIEHCLEIFVDFCSESEFKNNVEPNVPLSMLERRSELEVRSQKCGNVRVSPTLTTLRGRPPPTAALVAAVADVLCNTSIFKQCPVQEWNDQGLYRLLFRCTSSSNGTRAEVCRTRAAACRALFAATPHKCVRATLAATKDCLHNLLTTLLPFGEDECDAEYSCFRTQGLLLLGSLFAEKSASNTIWSELKDKQSTLLFYLLLQGVHSDENELKYAALYCLTQLAQSATNSKRLDKTKDESCVEFFNNLKSSFIKESHSDRYCAGDTARDDDCQPEYMAEELCKALMCLFQKMSSELKKFQSNQDDSWSRVCSCLSSVLSISRRSRMYGVHRQFPQVLLATLQALRDHLSLQGKPVDVIRNANNNPVLTTLYWLLNVINCLMLDCPPAKECFAENNIAASLNRLWPWCMMTEQLRDAVIHLLLTFTNDCPKAWASMSSCVGGRSLIGEVCALVSREAALQSRARAETLLVAALRTLDHCIHHSQCRTVILKSEALSCVYKLRVRERLRGGGGGGARAALCWARAWCGAARHADGAAAVLALRPLLAAPSVRAHLMPAIAHAAHHHRTTFLQSPDLLELLSGTLLTGDTSEVISAARAAWALAANNHKAKLMLRSAGVAAAVQSALQRLQRSPGDPVSQRAHQLLIYTNTVLQTT